MSIWVCGEVLIDLLPGTPNRVAIVGGGPANTAKALSRLGYEVQLGKWPVFHLALPGTKPENDNWIARKARVVHATGNSTMRERVFAEENSFDWYSENNLPEETHAIHGGGLPLNVNGIGLAGVLLISGLPQVQDHLLGVEVIAEFLARKGEQQ